MAAVLRQSSQSAPLAYNLASETAIDAYPDRKNIRNGGCTLYSATMVNGEVAKAYLKFFDSDGQDLTFGTTHPSIVIPVAASSTLEIDMPGGLALANGLSYTMGDNAAEDQTGAFAAATTELHLITS